jgi:hypothetical protein
MKKRRWRCIGPGSPCQGGFDRGMALPFYNNLGASDIELVVDNLKEVALHV